ncbi:hypothetical protein GC163_14235 [bacterium]|nr:hypothetical protein [bacterium]
MSARDTAYRWHCAGLGLTLTVAGCTLFSPFDLTPTDSSSQRSALPPLKAPADAIQLQIVFVERPIDDPLVSQLIWQDIDQVGAVPPAKRQVLEDNGLRVGQVGAHPPGSVQKLLGLTQELVDPTSSDQQFMRGRRLGLRSSQETEVQTIDALQEYTIHYQFAGQEEIVDYKQSRPIFKIKPVRIQEGWVRLEFTPEIHHGEGRMRPTPTNAGWELRGGQNTDARHALKFDVMLNNGEIAIVSGDGLKPQSFGYRCFCQVADGRRTQRVLIIRLADAGQSGESSLSK